MKPPAFRKVVGLLAVAAAMAFGGTPATTTFAGTPQNTNFTETVFATGAGGGVTSLAWATDGSNTLFVSLKSGPGRLRDHVAFRRVK